MKLEYTVSWFETNDFDGKVFRHSVDFYDYEKAVEFKRMHHPLGKVDRIADAPWHHSHAYHGHIETV